jgi:hypothetical protein
MGYLTPDLTGNDPLYRVSNFVRVISRTDQKFKFDTSVVYSGRHKVDIEEGRVTEGISLNVHLLGTLTIPLIYGQDWVILPDDIDEDETAQIKVQYPNFLLELVKSITIIRNLVTDVRINVEHSRLYPLQYRASYYKTEPLEVTPNLIADIIEKVEYLTQLTYPVHNVHTVSDLPKPLLLEPDPYQIRPENLIINEHHLINVPDNKFIIHPIAGPFFKDSLKVVYHPVIGADQTLKEGSDEDYLIFGLESKRTQIASNPSGIYRFILIRKILVGSIYITYHAYGGDPTLQDAYSLNELVNNIISHINQAKYLTPDSLTQTSVITQMLIRMNNIEDTMRRLLTQGKPTYGDVTRGTLLKRITAIDTDLHWYTIAELYKVEGSPEVILADTFHFRFQSIISKYMFEAIVGVDITNPNNPFDISILSENYPLGYIPFENYDDLDYMIRPQLRIIWNENTGQSSGILLQLGWQLKNAAEETIAIEDLSGLQSCWRLINEQSAAIGPEESLVQLPHPDHVWEPINPDSQHIAKLIPFKRGTLVWAGTQLLNEHAGTQHFTLQDHFLEDKTNISTLSKARLDLVEESAPGITHFNYPIFIDFSYEDTFKKGYINFEYNGKSARLILRIEPDATDPNKINILLDSDIDIGSLGNKLYLYHLILFSY